MNMTAEDYRQKEFLVLIVSECRFVTMNYDQLKNLLETNAQFKIQKIRDIPECPRCGEKIMYSQDWTTGRTRCCECGYTEG